MSGEQLCKATNCSARWTKQISQWKTTAVAALPQVFKERDHAANRRVANERRVEELSQLGGSSVPHVQGPSGIPVCLTSRSVAGKSLCRSTPVSYARQRT